MHQPRPQFVSLLQFIDGDGNSEVIRQLLYPVPELQGHIIFLCIHQRFEGGNNECPFDVQIVRAHRALMIPIRMVNAAVHVSRKPGHQLQ